MTSDPAPSRIINTSAKTAFLPLGVVRKGRSRTWLGDHGWWLILVEFQPSSWSQGTYLNVGAMWLWYAKDHFSFDVDFRASKFVEYHNDPQFHLAIQPLIRLAVQKVKTFRRDFSSIRTVAQYYKRKSRRDCWELYNGAIARGLAGDLARASTLLSRFAAIQDERDWIKAAQAVARRFLAVTDSPDRFAAEAAEEIQRARRLLKLPQLPDIRW
jgi:hypothetical protein